MTTASSLPRSRLLHVDINSYFATLLQQENPRLRGKPVGVVKSLGRTCLIATSKEAKQHGIKTGMGLYEARKLYPQLLTVAAEFDRYLDCTRRLKKIFESLAPDVCIFSLDEAFIDLTHCQRIYPDAQLFGHQVQQKIKIELGEWVTCNVGVSYNRLLAKLASEISPPDSVFQINEHNRDIILAQSEFKDICGIGHRLEKKLHRLGITNPYMINFYTEADLLPTFGPFWSKELKRIAQGEDSHILYLSGLADRAVQPMKSVGRTITGYKLANDEQHIKQVLYNLTEEVIYKIRRMDMAGRHVGVGLWGEEQNWYAHRTLKYYLRHTREMFEVIYGQLYQNWQRSFKVIKFGVFLSELKPMDQVDVTLLPEWHRQERVSQAVDAVTEKYGLFTVKPATMLNFEMIRPEVTGFLGDKKYYGL